MTTAFKKAWMLLKYKSAEEEERSYGDVSHREHPLHGQEGYGQSVGRGYEMMPDDEQEENRAHRIPMEGTKNPMEEDKRRASAEMMEDEGIEPPQPRGPPGDIGVAGSMSPQKPLEPNPFQMKRKPSL